MMSPLFLILAVTLLHLEIGVCNAVAVREKWGYVNVKKGGYMFWWLFHTDQRDYSKRPLVLWIQGGPGSPGSGLGNIMEIGPYDMNLHPRKNTWLTKANLLFVDNPVGTGFSYVTDKSALVRNNEQVTIDLLIALRSILQEVPEFKKSSLYIISESYGGKYTADFALVLQSAIENNFMECNFKGISLGDAWISPRDHVSSWGDYFYTMSLLDDTELKQVKDFSTQISGNLDRKQYMEAAIQYTQLAYLIEKFTNGSDWYHVLKNEGPVDSGCTRTEGIDDSVLAKLNELMNGLIRQKLGIIPGNVIWNYKSNTVFDALQGDYMKDVLSAVDNILINHSHLEVNVYNGQLDSIVNNLGVLKWIKRLKWSGISEFQAAPKQPMMFPRNQTAGFSKSYKQLNFYWVLKAGHYVPHDAPEASLMMLDMILAKKCPMLSLFCL